MLLNALLLGIHKKTHNSCAEMLLVSAIDLEQLFLTFGLQNEVKIGVKTVIGSFWATYSLQTVPKTTKDSPKGTQNAILRPQDPQRWSKRDPKCNFEHSIVAKWSFPSNKQ